MPRARSGSSVRCASCQRRALRLNRRVRRPAPAPFGSMRRPDRPSCRRLLPPRSTACETTPRVASTMAAATRERERRGDRRAGHAASPAYVEQRPPRRPRDQRAAPRPPSAATRIRNAAQATPPPCSSTSARTSSRNHGRSRTVRSRSSHQPLSSSICRTARCRRRRSAIDAEQSRARRSSARSRTPSRLRSTNSSRSAWPIGSR